MSFIVFVRNSWQKFGISVGDLKNKDAVLATLMNAQNKDGCRLNTIEQYCARHLNKKPWGLIDSVNGTFRRYFIENNMVEKVELFKRI